MQKCIIFFILQIIQIAECLDISEDNLINTPKCFVHLRKTLFTLKIFLKVRYKYKRDLVSRSDKYMKDPR